jgi:hypothetical protein
MRCRMTQLMRVLRNTSFGLVRTVDRDVRVGVDRPRLTILVVMWNTVPVRAIEDVARWRGSRRRLDGIDDARLGVGVRHRLALEEPVDAPDFELEASHLLVHLNVLGVRLGARHLQQDETLLRTLLDVDNALLQATVAAVNPLREPHLHALQLIQHQAEVGVDGCSGGGRVPWILEV